MNKHGGKRPGSGRKKSLKKGKQVNFWVPEEFVPILKRYVEEMRKQWAGESVPQKNPSESLPDKKRSESVE